MGKFFKSIGGFFAKLFSHAPSWSQTASTTLTLATPMLNTFLQLTAGQDVANETVNVIGEIKSDLAAVATWLSQSHDSADPSVIAQIRATLTAVNTNLAALLQAGHIKNPDTLSKVTIAVNAFTGEISAILDVLPKTAA